MAVISGYTTAVVLLNRHEPEHEVGQRLLQLAKEKGYDVRTVEAQRGEHDTPLAFRVPQDVAEEFNADRGDRWSDKIENDAEKTDDQGEPRHLAGDAYAADNYRRADQARADNTTNEDTSTPSARTQRPGKAQTK